ncbi:glycosyltransferase family 4 protein [Flavobacterium sp.]|uniref:glycosyltransferase family 4 protein n=1 Tax=Flavobacterium sp. TaxID=239 RepID=UPI0025C3D35C|nr:glycosyltransferase family 4 protein [Flavobacterium sp.]
MKRSKVICVHIGARAHYLIPKAVLASGLLHSMITDTWIRSAFLRRVLTIFPLRSLRALAGRYTEALSSSRVYSLGISFLLYDFYLRLKYGYSWSLNILRDKKFKKEAAEKILRIKDATSVFAISYTALDSFRVARQKKLKTILFQIDPGLEEENIVRGLINSTSLKTDWEPAPLHYWEECKEEHNLSDVIIVNSQWSKSGLIKQGVPAEKIQVIPLPYEIEEQNKKFKRSYSSAFTKERPLRCLFLGTLALRKGIHIVIDAAAKMQELPVEFVLVGRSEIQTQEINLPNMRYVGIVTREETNQFYKASDVFLFPTFSDGFGLTQLEAMSWQLPVVATRQCGEVVTHEHDGWILDNINADALVALLKNLIAKPESIKFCSENSLSTVEKFSVQKFTEDIALIL